jgi:glutamyl-tRNA reductase
MSLPSIDTAGTDVVTEPAAPVVDRSLDERLATPFSLVVFETSLATASIAEVEAATQGASREWLARCFESDPETLEAALLATCHRVEVLLLLRTVSAADRWKEALPGRPDRWRRWQDREAARHLFRVAAGRESLALGEVEVRRQVAAARSSVMGRNSRPILKGLLSDSLDGAELARPPTTPPASVAAIASEELLRLYSQDRPTVLVVGSGTVGREVARRLSGHARVTIAFHRTPPEEEFLRSVGATAVPFEQIHELLPRVDAVVSAAKVGRRAIRVTDVPPDRPICLVDLGVPRNIDPEVRARSNVTLIDVGDLYGRPRRAPGEHDLAGDSTLDDLADRWSDGFDRERLEPWIAAVRRAAEEARRSELATARPYLGALGPEQEAAVDRLTRRLVARLLDPATSRLRNLPGGGDGELLRRLALELLTPEPTDP